MRRARRDDSGAALVQTVLGAGLVFGVLIPLIMQLLVLVFSGLVGLFAAQGAADQLRKHPDDPAAAQARALRVVHAFGGDTLLRHVDVEVSVEDGRAVAVVKAQARPVVPGFTVPVHNRAAGAVERFRADTRAGS